MTTETDAREGTRAAGGGDTGGDAPGAVVRAINEASDEAFFAAVGNDVQTEVLDADPDDTDAVVVTLRTSPAWADAREDALGVDVALAWAVDDVAGCVALFREELGDPVVAFARDGDAPTLDEIRSRVRTAVREGVAGVEQFRDARAGDDGPAVPRCGRCGYAPRHHPGTGAAADAADLEWTHCPECGHRL